MLNNQIKQNVEKRIIFTHLSKYILRINTGYYDDKSLKASLLISLGNQFILIKYYT